MSWKIPLFDTDFGPEEVHEVSKVIESGWLTMGEKVEEFERQFAKFIGVRHAIAVSSCTAALHLSCLALGLGLGDEVICPSLTFVATANCIKYVGAKPIFADIENLNEWLISLRTIKSVITDRTKAICVVHYAGYPCEMDAICEFAKSEGLYVIEDCAHALGASYKGKSVGTWGDVGCFSFFSNKNMSTGEGGMVTTNDDTIAEKVRLLRSHGMTSVTLDRFKGHSFSYDVVAIGYNYRPTEMMAALGIVQLKKLPHKNELRRKIMKEYRHLIKSHVPEIRIPFLEKDLNESAAHIMPILLPEKINRYHIMAEMAKAGIQTSIHYRPIHTFTAYTKDKGVNCNLYNTEYVGRHSITLPLYPNMNSEDVYFCVKILKDSISKF